MNLDDYLDQLNWPGDTPANIEAAHSLEAFTDDSRVMDVLCAAAVHTDSHTLREVLLKVLKTNTAGAYARFSDVALWSKKPLERKHALMILSLMGCGSAKNAVISGLYDPDASVRKAAAMNVGLYDDKDVKHSLERYFERHGYDLTLALIAEGSNGGEPLTSRLTMI